MHAVCRAAASMVAAVAIAAAPLLPAAASGPAAAGAPVAIRRALANLSHRTFEFPLIYREPCTQAGWIDASHKDTADIDNRDLFAAQTRDAQLSAVLARCALETSSSLQFFYFTAMALNTALLALIGDQGMHEWTSADRTRAREVARIATWLASNASATALQQRSASIVLSQLQQAVELSGTATHARYPLRFAPTPLMAIRRFIGQARGRGWRVFSLLESDGAILGTYGNGNAGGFVVLRRIRSLGWAVVSGGGGVASTSDATRYGLPLGAIAKLGGAPGGLLEPGQTGASSRAYPPGVTVLLESPKGFPLDEPR